LQTPPAPPPFIASVGGVPVICQLGPADNLSKAGWSGGCVSAVDSRGRTIWIVDAHCDDGKRFVVHADEKLAAFLEPTRLLSESGSMTSAIDCLTDLEILAQRDKPPALPEQSESDL
jgi:hypothetical protein